jgi:hypothetical protein
VTKTRAARGTSIELVTHLVENHGLDMAGDVLAKFDDRLACETVVR